MSWTKTHDLCVKIGKYKDEDGETKYRFAKVGKVLTSDTDEETMVLDRHFNPAGALNEGREGVTLYKFVDKKSYPQYRDPPQPKTQEELDKMPFPERKPF